MSSKDIKYMLGLLETIINGSYDDAFMAYNQLYIYILFSPKRVRELIKSHKDLIDKAYQRLVIIHVIKEL